MGLRGAYYCFSPFSTEVAEKYLGSLGFQEDQAKYLVQNYSRAVGSLALMNPSLNMDDLQKTINKGNVIMKFSHERRYSLKMIK